ncbi:MAG: YIP1 family protein [Gemmatimonadetes bacterium]|nr:MAG: YIP1 family protein [Gemmatimonadota bacterium]
MRTPPQPPRGPTPPRGPASPQRGPAGAKPAPPRAAPRKPSRRLPAWLARAQRLLLRPAQEWQAITPEFATPGPIYSRYIVPMAAIGPISATVGTIVFGVRNSIAGSYGMSPGDAVTSGVLEFGLNLLGVYLFAVLIDVLAPSFGGQRNRVQALKVAAYGSTPYWLGGIVALFPKLSLIGGVFALYSVRLLALGLPPLMKVPRDKTVAYTLLASIAGVILVLIIGPLTAVVVGR